MNAQLNQQIQIVRIASNQLAYSGRIEEDIRQEAKEMGISEGRLRAMAKFFITSGEPKQYRRFP